jgi:tetratricopeptide (TPR) repeat protein
MTSSTPTPLLSLHQLSLYNTGRMSPEQIIAAFAARQQQLERIVADIAAEKPKSRAQHHQIVGQRGMGKTMLLARIAAELRTKAEFSARFIPLVFAEEQYSVDRLSKFWLNCLDSLADARELARDTAGVDEIDAIVSRLTAAGARTVKDDQPFADQAYEDFAQVVKTSGQRPVLLVDNLQLVFDRLEHGQQHSLRELLMRPGSPILVGASPSPPPASQDYGAAFYDQFKVHYLRPLDETEMRALLVHLADVAQRDDVRQRVLQHPARLTVLRQLTGGNPRTALTLFFLYAEDFAPSVFGDLEGLLDRVTPLYKARFEELTPQQQVVASAIANHWDPVTAATLATATGLPASTISGQLDRLQKTGVVECTELFGETSIGYQLAERFFNIWFLMRSASRRQRREVEFLTRFLESFYEPDDRRRIARHLMAEEHFSPDRYLWSRAVAASLTERETAEELNRHAELTALNEEADDARTRLRELIDFGSMPAATLAFDDLRRKIMSLIPENAGITPVDFAKVVLGDRLMFVNGEREQLATRGGTLGGAEIRSILETARKSRAVDELIYSTKATEWLSQWLIRGQLRARDDAEDWNRAFHQASGASVFKLLVDSLPFEFGSVLSDSTLERITAVLRPTATASASQWYNWGRILTDKLGHYADAEFAYRQAIKLNPQIAAGWNALGNLLHLCLQKPVEAEKAFREAISLDSKAAFPWSNLGNLLQDQLRFEEAETAFRQSIALDPRHSDSWNGLGNLYCDHFDRHSEAAEAFGNAVRLEPTNEIFHQNRLFLSRDFMGEGHHARPMLDQLLSLRSPKFPDTNHLHEALSAGYDSNWGSVATALSKALTIRAGGFVPSNTDDWLRASAVLLHLNYGAELVAFLDQRGDTARLRPWVEALRALHIGDRRALQNIAPEIRTTAEIFYDGIESRLKKLPEKTRRRPLPKPATPKRTRARRR